MNITNIKLEFRSLRRIFDVLAVKWVRNSHSFRESYYSNCNLLIFRAQKLPAMNIVSLIWYSGSVT